MKMIRAFTFRLLMVLFLIIMFVLPAMVLIPSEAQINPLPMVLPPANLDDLCEVYEPLEDLNGPHCLNPVSWDIDGFTHINSIVTYLDGADALIVGRVAGYVWHRGEDRYYYLIERYDGFASYESVAPERLR